MQVIIGHKSSEKAKVYIAHCNQFEGKVKDCAAALGATKLQDAP